MWDLVGNPEDRFSHNQAHFRSKFSIALSSSGTLEGDTSDCLSKLSIALSSGILEGDKSECLSKLSIALSSGILEGDKSDCLSKLSIALSSAIGNAGHYDM